MEIILKSLTFLLVRDASVLPKNQFHPLCKNCEIKMPNIIHVIFTNLIHSNVSHIKHLKSELKRSELNVIQRTNLTIIGYNQACLLFITTLMQSEISPAHVIT